MYAYRLIVSCASLVLCAAPVFAETKLAPAFQEGSSFKTKETVVKRQSLKLAGQSVDTASDTTLVYETKAGQRDDKGELALEITYTEVISSVTLPGDKKVSYNSTTEEVKSDDPTFQIIVDRLKALKGLKLTIVLDRENQVKEVTGLAPEAGLTPDDVKNSMQQSLARYPKEPVNPGDTWEREDVQPLGQGQVFTIKRKFKYVGPEANATDDSKTTREKVTITSEDIQYSVRPNAGFPGTVNKSDLKVASSEASFLFDPAKGRTVEAHDKMHVTGELVLTIMGVDLNGEFDLSMEKNTVEIP